MKEDIHMMLDLETMGVGPKAAIIQIGATAFQISPHRIIECVKFNVDLESSVNVGMQMDCSTVLWWLQQDQAARESITQNAVSVNLPIALLNLNEFKKRNNISWVWGNGATFDNVIIRQAYQLCGIECPWSYKRDMCFRTVRAMWPWIEEDEFTGTPHDAGDDSIHQVKHFFKILRSLES